MNFKNFNIKDLHMMVDDLDETFVNYLVNETDSNILDIFRNIENVIDELDEEIFDESIFSSYYL
jgi:hypothetical protein